MAKFSVQSVRISNVTDIFLDRERARARVREIERVGVGLIFICERFAWDHIPYWRSTVHSAKHSAPKRLSRKLLVAKAILICPNPSIKKKTGEFSPGGGKQPLRVMGWLAG